MTKMTKSFGIIAGIIVFGGAYYLYTTSKKHYAKVILKSGNYGGNIYTLLTFDKGFLKAWASAKSSSFTYNGKEYITSGGKAKVIAASAIM